MTRRLVSVDSDNGTLPQIVLDELSTRFGSLAAATDYTQIVHVGDTGGISGYGWVSDGVSTDSNTQLRHNVAADVSELQLIYVNSTAITDNPNPITVRSSVLHNAAYSPVYFNGQRDVTIAPGARVVSDPLPISTTGPTAASAFNTRTRVTVAAGGTWPITIETVAARNEGVVNGTAGDDLTLGGTVTANAARGYGPVAMIGKTRRADRTTVALIGDSITGGVGGASPIWYNGFSRLACNALGKVSIDVAYPGSSASRGYGFAFRSRGGIIRHATHSIEMYGTNDIAASTLATIQTWNVLNWRDRSARGVRTYACTLVPRVTSTDSYATTVNQTDAAGNSTTRVQFNDWIRAGAPVTPAMVPTTAGASDAILFGQPGHPALGYFETADAVESARNSSRWKVDGTANKYTADGIHPTAFAHQVMADAMVASWPVKF